MKLENDLDQTVKRYSDRYKTYGLSPKTLGCGFGDSNKVISSITRDYKYTGIDIVPELVGKAKGIYKNERNLSFVLGDFLSYSFDESFDVVLASGVFNHRFEYSDNYDFIKNCMNKAFDLSDIGVSFDFLSDQVDFKHSHTFHSSPPKNLEFAYSLSRNIVLRNNYMPFEFSITIMKDDSFDKKDTIFNTYKSNIGINS